MYFQQIQQVQLHLRIHFMLLQLSLCVMDDLHVEMMNVQMRAMKTFEKYVPY